MADSLNRELRDRQAYPFAVGVRLGLDKMTTYYHFNNMQTAAMFASLMQNELNNVTRWVAVVEPVYVMSVGPLGVTAGWRQVTYFHL